MNLGGSAEVGIIGGGPAGSYLGYILAKAGKKVTIFNKKRMLEKPCGGAVDIGVLQNRAIFANSDLLKSPSCNRPSLFRFITSAGESKINLQGSILVFNRAIFDDFLQNQAMNAGVRIVWESVSDLEHRDNRWIIQTKNSLISANILVGADGVNSLVRRKLVGRIPKNHLCLTVGFFAEGVHNDTMIIATTDFEGYIWAFPRPVNTCIGIGERLTKANPQLMWNKLETFVKKTYSYLNSNSRWAALLPAPSSPDFYDLPSAGQNWLLVGDAAGHVCPITGAGIPFALRSAELAADAILQGDPKLYDSLWRQTYGRTLTERSEIIRKVKNLSDLIGPKAYELALEKYLGREKYID